MASIISRGPSEVAIFGRLLDAAKEDMSRELARYLLTLGFAEQDQARMNQLAADNRAGTLSPEDQEELQVYVKAAHLLALLHSKARQKLKRRKVC